MAIEIVDLPINSMVIFQFAMLVYQKVVRFFSNYHEPNREIGVMCIVMWPQTGPQLGAISSTEVPLGAQFAAPFRNAYDSMGRSTAERAPLEFKLLIRSSKWFKSCMDETHRIYVWYIYLHLGDF